MKTFKESEEDNTKTEDTTISSSSSKKFKRKRNTEYAPINYTISDKQLPKIKEEKENSSSKENDTFNLLSDDGKDNDNYISIMEDNNNNNNDNIDKIDIDEGNKIQINDETNEQDNEKSGKKAFKQKKENFIDLSEFQYNEGDTDIKIEPKKYNYPKEDKDKRDNSKKSKKSKDSKTNEFSKANSKNKIDLKFLDDEERQEEQEGDFKMYIQKAYDEEEEFKIIYEFNKMPFKPKVGLIDLSIFDNTSFLKCISKCYFDKSQQNFNFKLYFIYISNQSPLEFSEENAQKILESLDNEKNKNNTSEEKDKENKENDDLPSDKDTIGLTISLFKFKMSSGKERIGPRTNVKLKKYEEFKSINSEAEIYYKEDLYSYANYHKIFYILTIKKNIFIKSKKFFNPEKIGIKNEGNTCYMNSIIQSLYNNPFMLKQIMNIDVDKNELLNKKENQVHKEVIIALQNIFYELFTKKSAIKIIRIFYAFDWKRDYWNSPQDAEEIYIRIFEIISKYNNEIRDNCEGILENTIDVESINYKSTKEENFFFMQLDLEKNSSVDECLEHFFESEKLNGDNKYQYINAEGEKILYDAEKYYKFKKIPNFLFLQLKRFTFDTTTFTFDKKNKAISYKEEIDLTKYFHSNNNSSKSKKKKEQDQNKEIYTLYCILVHSGSVDNGHYYCIAKDFKNKVYIKYNDTTISVADKKEIFNQLFGGEQIEYTIENVNKKKSKLEPWYEVKDKKIEIKRNAYILIYVKKSEIRNLFNEDNIKDILNSFAKSSKRFKSDYDMIENNELNKNKKILDYMPGFKFIPKDKNILYNNNRRISKNNNANKNQRNNFNNKNSSNYNFQHQTKENKNYIRNTEINMEINLSDFKFGDTIDQMKSNNPQRRIIRDVKNEQKKTIFYEYRGDNSINKQNSKKIYDKIQTSDFSKNGFRNLGMKFYLIPDISHRSSCLFEIKYNSKIFVRDVKSLIRDHLNTLNNSQGSINIFEQITQSEGYKLALVNSFGFFLEFLENENYELTNILKYDHSPEKLKHLCLYDLPEIKIGVEIKDLIAVHFVKSSVLKMIKKNEIYLNYDFQTINVPVFLVNKDIRRKEVLIESIKDLYIDYFGKSAEKNVQFKIKIIKESDIRDLNVTKITYVDLDVLNFKLYFVYGSDVGIGYNRYNTKRLLVGI